MIYPRKLLSTLSKQIKSEEIIVLTGMRRVGKTTLYRELFDLIPSESKVFLDIENPLDQKVFEELDYSNIWQNLGKKQYVFLDEIQAMPQIVKPIKYLYDHYRVKFFLTGSSSFYLKNLFPESLAGRKIIFELYPLDFSEFLTFKHQSFPHYSNLSAKEKHKNIFAHEQIIKLFDEYLRYGGFPGVVIQPDPLQKSYILKDIFKSYYEKDIKGMADFRNLKAVRDLILLLAERVGSRLDITKLSSELGVSRETVYSYLAFLEATYFITTISPYSLNVDREISGGNKAYFCDTGLLNQISHISTGHIFENAVYLNLKHLGKINYYQKRKSGKEIDFVINQKIAIEVESKATKNYLSDLASLSTKIGLKSHYIISKEYSDLKNVIPATCL